MASKLIAGLLHNLIVAAIICTLVWLWFGNPKPIWECRGHEVCVAHCGPNDW